MSEAEISNYFEDLRADFIGAYYGMYFLEICDYYTRENNEETGTICSQLSHSCTLSIITTALYYIQLTLYFQVFQDF